MNDLISTNRQTGIYLYTPYSLQVIAGKLESIPDNYGPTAGFTLDMVPMITGSPITPLFISVGSLE